MTEELYPPPRGRRSQARSRSTPPWPMIIGVALLGILAAVMAILLFGGDGGDPDASASPTASASAPASDQPSSEASASASESPLETGTPGPTPTPVSLDLDSTVATTVTDLSVREGPSIGAKRLGSLEAGVLSFVAGGPVDADGYRWYLLSGMGLPPSSGCIGPIETDPYDCPIWFGWVAAADANGSPWLTAEAPECPSEPIQADELILGVTDLVRLVCFGSDPFTFRGYWPEMPDDAGLGGACASQDEPGGWLICQNINDNGVVIDETQEFGGVGINVSIDPASGVSMPARGTWIELTVHLDDPAAQACGDTTAAGERDGPPEQWILYCRGQMVVESVSTVDGP